jgi:hypothetical protein
MLFAVTAMSFFAGSSYPNTVASILLPVTFTRTCKYAYGLLAIGCHGIAKIEH